MIKILNPDYFEALSDKLSQLKVGDSLYDTPVAGESLLDAIEYSFLWESTPQGQEWWEGALDEGYVTPKLITALYQVCKVKPPVNVAVTKKDCM